MKIKIITACDKAWNIGKDGTLPWVHMKEDMEIFRSKTTNGDNPGVVMGRKTWDSLPKRHRPLKDRVNIVMTRTIPSIDGAMVATDVDTVINVASANNIDTLWVIGGSNIYKEFIEKSLVDEAYITRIDKVYEGCDTIFPYDVFTMSYRKEEENDFSSSNLKLERWLFSISKS